MKLLAGQEAVIDDIVGDFILSVSGDSTVYGKDTM